MSRIVNAGNTTELAKDSILGCIMVDLDFASGHVYANDGFIDIVYSGHTYIAVGQFGGIDVAEEGIDQVARPIKLTLSGVDPSLVSTATTEIYQNRSALVYLALINQTTGGLVANPETIWEGRMDYMQIDIDQGKGSITVNCEHRLRREPRIARYTDVDQQQAHAGDTFFNFQTQILGFKSQWGNQNQTYAGPPMKTPTFPGWPGWHK